VYRVGLGQGLGGKRHIEQGKGYCAARRVQRCLAKAPSATSNAASATSCLDKAKVKRILPGKGKAKVTSAVSDKDQAEMQRAVSDASVVEAPSATPGAASAT